MLKYLIWYEVLLEATTYKNSLRLCFLRYFLVRYLRYLLENAIDALTVTFFSSLLTLTESPSLAILPPIFILCLRYSANVAVLKTLSSTGFEQSIVKDLTLSSTVSFLVVSFLILASLGWTLGWAYFVVIQLIFILILIIFIN